MTQRERLIELILNSGVIEQFFDYEEQEAERLADYLLENGVIVPPCKVGDELYKPHQQSDYYNGEVVQEVRIRADGVVVETDTDSYYAEEIGKTVFLTREAAERALKERGE